MSLSQVPEIPRAFAEWGTEQVIQWLSTLKLSCDYAKQFRDHNIDGPALLRLNPTSLSSLGITDSLDRVKLLQQITTMQADLASQATPTRRWRGLGKFRRYSDNTPAYQTLAVPPSRRVSSEEWKSRTVQGHSRTQLRPNMTDGHLSPQNRTRTQSVYSFAGTAPSTPGTFYSMADTSSSVIGTSHSDVGVSRPDSTLAGHPLTRMAYSDVGLSQSRSGERKGEGSPLQRGSSRLKDKKKRLSRSMDKLWEAQVAGNLLPLVADSHGNSGRGMTRYHSTGPSFRDSMAHQESVSVRLHNGPSHRSTTSVQLPDGTLYDDPGSVRLHGSTHLLDILREENATLKRELETYYHRVRKLMRLEQELERVREAHRLLEESNRRRKKLEQAMRSRLENELVKLRAEQRERPADAGKIERSDSLSKKRLQREESCGEQASVSDIHSSEGSLVFSLRIERLRHHLHSLQQISLRREELEQRVRKQLQSEIRQLRGTDAGKDEGKEKDGEVGTNWESEVALLQADLAKWEQRCTELAAEKELAVEMVLTQKEGEIAQLRQALLAKEEEARLLAERNQRCQCQPTPSPLHKAHSSPSHQSPPHHKLHTSPTHSSPTHQAMSSPSHTHRLHKPPSHHVYSSPAEPHSDAHIHLPHTPSLTNGGENPAISAPSTSPAELSQATPTTHQQSVTDLLVPPAGSPQHGMKRVKAKTPPPRNEVLQKSYKYSSLDRGPPVSHTPSELQLFNTLLGDAVPGEETSGRGVNANGKYSIKGVNPLYSYSPANRV